MSNESASHQHDLQNYRQRHMELRHREEEKIDEARVLSIRLDPTFNKWLTAIVKTSTYGQTDVVRRLITASLNMLDAGMGVGRAQDRRIGLARQIHIVAEPASPGQQPQVLLARDRLTDAVALDHASPHL